jgi:hypothetical protein
MAELVDVEASVLGPGKGSSVVAQLAVPPQLTRAPPEPIYSDRATLEYLIEEERSLRRSTRF